MDRFTAEEDRAFMADLDARFHGIGMSTTPRKLICDLVLVHGFPRDSRAARLLLVQNMVSLRTNERLSSALQQYVRVVNWFLVSGPGPDPDLRVRHFFCLFGGSLRDMHARYLERERANQRDRRRLERDLERQANEARAAEERIRAEAARVEAARAEAVQQADDALLAEATRRVQLDWSAALCDILLQIHEELQRTA